MASRKPKTSDGQGIDDQIIGGIRAIMSPWLGTPPGELPVITRTKELERETANMMDQQFAGGMIGAGVKGNKALAKQAAINAAALGVGYGVGKAVGAVAGAYQTAKSTSLVNSKNIPLFHGGPSVLKGNTINPSFQTPSTKMLNQQAISSIPSRVETLAEKVRFMQNNLNVADSYASKNVAETLQGISKNQQSIKQIETWGAKAKKTNYFTAVDDPSNTYQQGGSIYVINPKKTDVQIGFGPSSEFQVAGKQRPIAKIPVVKTGAGEYDSNAVNKARQIAERLQKQNARKVILQETLKNLKRR